MKINKQSLQARINRLSFNTGINANVLYTSYFFDCFIHRVALSLYKDRFVFKGGFYLSMALGLEHRYTEDIDFLLRNEGMSESNIKRIIEEIIGIDADDEVILTFQKISPIRTEDVYGGFNISLLARLENVRWPLSVDIATGDPITPDAITFAYKPMFGEEEIELPSYNFETILAEKIQTLLKRGSFNSRSKDYYDIYAICSARYDEIDANILKEAFANTCKHRNTQFSSLEAMEIFHSIQKDAEMQKRWASYSKKHLFAKGISYDALMDKISLMMALLF